MVHLAILVLSVAILYSLASALVGRMFGYTPPPPAPWRARVLLLAPISCDWKSILNHTIQTSHAPQCLQVRILAEVDQFSESTELETASLRAVCRLSHTRARPGLRAPGRARRLLRHFGEDGGADFTVLLDPRTELMPGWDAKIASLLSASSPFTILSCPGSKGGIPCFPTLLRSTGARGSSLPFCVRNQDTTTPTVCWCAEATAGRPEAFQKWGATLRHAKSAWSSTTKYHQIPTTALCTAPALTFQKEDAGEPEGSVTRSMELGLSANASVEEQILKFGSTQAAEVALRG